MSSTWTRICTPVAGLRAPTAVMLLALGLGGPVVAQAQQTPAVSGATRVNLMPQNETQAEPDSAKMLGPNTSRWSIGAYAGVLSGSAFYETLTNIRYRSSYIAAVDVTYSAFKFDSLPLSIDIDATVAKRFGQDSQWDFGIIPMARWKYFPWNDYVYTNLRVGLIGVSYVTGISPWELHWSGNGHGSQFLNYLAVEVDVAPKAESPSEFFVRVHHRSGAWGLINGTYGGSTYVTLGWRRHL